MGKASRIKRDRRSASLAPRTAVRSSNPMSPLLRRHSAQAETGPQCYVVGEEGRPVSMHEIVIGAFASDDLESLMRWAACMLPGGVDLLDFEFVGDFGGERLAVSIYWQAWGQSAFRCLERLLDVGFSRRPLDVGDFVGTFIGEFNQSDPSESRWGQIRRGAEMMLRRLVMDYPQHPVVSKLRAPGLASAAVIDEIVGQTLADEEARELDAEILVERSAQVSAAKQPVRL